jgi:hypothetical protein
MEAMFPETSDYLQTTWRCNPENSILHNHHCRKIYIENDHHYFQLSAVEKALLNKPRNKHNYTLMLEEHGSVVG